MVEDTHSTRSPVKHMRLSDLLSSSGNKAKSKLKRGSNDSADAKEQAERPEIEYTRREVRAQISDANHQPQHLHPHQNLDVDPLQRDGSRSPGGGAWSGSYDHREAHPLVSEVFLEPQHIAAFAEALRVDLGQQDVISPQLLLADDHSGAQSPHKGAGAMSPRSESGHTFASASTHRSSLVSALWKRLPFSAADDDASAPPSPSAPPRDNHGPASSVQKDPFSAPSGSTQANVNSSLNTELEDKKTLASSGMARTPSLTRTSHPRNVGRISAASDFAPVHERVQKRSRRGSRRSIDTGGREGLLYKLLRFPLLVCIFLVIGFEFALYVLVRQMVNIVEYLIAFRGQKGQLRKRLRAAQTWEEWKTTALELDNFLGLQRWKEEDASGLYDWILVKKVTASLRTHRDRGDAEKLLEVLELCLKNNFAGVENFKLFSQTYFGTKNLVERFATETEESLRFIHETNKISLEEKRIFYRRVAKNLGKSALCLSGGGSFGYYHVGVVRALLDANLLPNIISGTSAGGLIAALACTRTDEELKELLVPALADRITACEEPLRIWAARAYKTGARFDTVAWASKATFFTRGSTTFLEAYQRTGKILNVSVIPADRHSPVKLLNHLTSPHCIIWSSLLASAAVPGLLNPVCLMQKTKDGEAIPYNLGHRFKDGSLRVDIPLEELHALFQVNYPIVSQVNPHIHLFHFAPQGTPGRPVAHRHGKGWRGGFLLSAFEHVLKLHLAMNFKIIRDLDLLPRLLGTDWSSVFLQRFTGAVTIIPKTRFWDWMRILSDPDRKELARMLRVSQSVSFPKLHMIENRMRLENAIESGRRACRRAIRARQLEEAGSAPVTPSETSGRPNLQTLPSYVGSDTEHDDFFSSRKRSSQSDSSSRGVRTRLRELHGFTAAFDDAARDGGPGTPDERRGSDHNPLQYRGGATDDDLGTSEDGDHKLAGKHGHESSRPPWLDRGDGFSSDEDEEDGLDEVGGPQQSSGHEGQSAADHPHHHRRRNRSWSFARASAAFRNTFSPTKAERGGVGSPQQVQSPAGMEDETSSGEEERGN
ncbi:hypothetical protein V8E36_004185 [Tilletia maclaganii]